MNYIVLSKPTFPLDSMNNFLIERFVRYRETLTEEELKSVEDLLSHSEQAREWKRWIETFYQKKDELDNSEAKELQTIPLFLIEAEAKLEQLITSPAYIKLAAKTQDCTKTKEFIGAYSSKDSTLLLRVFMQTETNQLHGYLLAPVVRKEKKSFKLIINNDKNPLEFNEKNEVVTQLTRTISVDEIRAFSYSLIKSKS